MHGFGDREFASCPVDTEYALLPSQNSFQSCSKSSGNYLELTTGWLSASNYIPWEFLLTRGRMPLPVSQDDRLSELEEGLEMKPLSPERGGGLPKDT